jgi:hypothetical protein
VARRLIQTDGNHLSGSLQHFCGCAEAQRPWSFAGDATRVVNHIEDRVDEIDVVFARGGSTGCEMKRSSSSKISVGNWMRGRTLELLPSM